MDGLLVCLIAVLFVCKVFIEFRRADRPKAEPSSVCPEEEGAKVGPDAGVVVFLYEADQDCCDDPMDTG